MYTIILKRITVAFVCLTVLIPATLFRLPSLHEKYAIAEEISSDYSTSNDAIVLNKIDIDDTDEGQASDKRLRIEIPKGIAEESISLENDYLSQTLYITMDVDIENYFTDYSITGSSNHISAMQYYRQNGCGIIAITMDKLYEVRHELKDRKLSLEFVNPHDVYDKIVVIDAGHGSRMAGAVRNGIQEKDINLAILLKLKELFDEYDGSVGVYYTRTTDVNPTLQQRAALANKVDADLFISIHNNSSGSGNFTSVKGTQVLYSESDEREKGSMRLAQICLDNVTGMLSSRAAGLIKGDDIYIIRTSNAPVALVEVGFMTNREELEQLSSEEYQKSAAQGIFNSIIQAFEEGF